MQRVVPQLCGHGDRVLSRRHIEELPRRERKHLDWIRPGMWALIDQRASLRKQGALTMVEGRRLGRRIKASLQSDRDHRALQAGHSIMGHLGDMEVRKTWGVLRGWHKEVDPAASKLCYRTLDKQMEEREALYRRRDPPQCIPLLFNPELQ